MATPPSAPPCYPSRLRQPPPPAAVGRRAGALRAADGAAGAWSATAFTRHAVARPAVPPHDVLLPIFLRFLRLGAQ
ncbi:MAG TPA: hypothetical protein VFH47_09390, partial [Candidatus Thermoplasmatota archaeon]|nr:hypothetical protein [Candidatus Thermoplasmatota archaeon]